MSAEGDELKILKNTEQQSFVFGREKSCSNIPRYLKIAHFRAVLTILQYLKITILLFKGEIRCEGLVCCTNIKLYPVG